MDGVGRCMRIVMVFYGPIHLKGDHKIDHLLDSKVLKQSKVESFEQDVAQ